MSNICWWRRKKKVDTFSSPSSGEITPAELRHPALWKVKGKIVTCSQKLRNDQSCTYCCFLWANDSWLFLNLLQCKTDTHLFKIKKGNKHILKQRKYWRDSPYDPRECTLCVPSPATQNGNIRTHLRRRLNASLRRTASLNKKFFKRK